MSAEEIEGVRSLVRTRSLLPANAGLIDRFKTYWNDLFSVDQDIIGSFNPNPDRISIDLYDRNPYLLTHLKSLTELPAQDQHAVPP